MSQVSATVPTFTVEELQAAMAKCEKEGLPESAKYIQEMLANMRGNVLQGDLLVRHQLAALQDGNLDVSILVALLDNERILAGGYPR